MFARRIELLDHLAAQIRANGSRVLVIAGDALDKNSAEDAVHQTVNTFGDIDAAVLNVGEGPAFNMSVTTICHGESGTVGPYFTQISGELFIEESNSLKGLNFVCNTHKQVIPLLMG